MRRELNRADSRSVNLMRWYCNNLMSYARGCALAKF